MSRMRRAPTTTQSIRERFPEEYISLQQQSDVVLSCAQQFSWAGGYGQLLGGAGILQKLPFRTYIGIKKTDTGRIEYGQARAYSPVRQKFMDISLGHFIDTNITRTFKEHILPLLPPEYRWSGFEIRLLLESDWIDVVPFFVSFSAGILLLSGTLSPDFFSEVAETHTSQLRDPLIEQQLALVWKVCCLLENGYLYTPSMTEVIACLMKARMPLLTQTADMTHQLSDDGRFVMRPEQLERPCEWYIYKYDEHFPRHQLIPVEWGIVSPGSHQMRSLHFPYTKALPRFGDMQSLEEHMQYPLPQAHLPVHDPYWFRRKIELLHFYTMATVDTFGRSLVTYDAGPFLHALHAMHEMSQLLQHHELDHVTAPGSGPFKEFLKQHLRGNCKYLITEKGLRGEAKIFFAAPRYMLSGHMDALSELYPENGAAAFEYASWLDGFGNTGLEIDYVRPFLLPAAEKESFASPGMLPPDILVDCERGKLYLGGNRVTSNDLRSQHFTVQLLHLLHQAPGQRVLLSDLPRLSYTDTAKELQQKVLQPLVRATERHTGRQLRLYCETRDNQPWICLDASSVVLHFTHEESAHLQCRKSAAVQPHLVAM